MPPIFENEEEFDAFFSNKEKTEAVLGRVLDRAVQRVGGEFARPEAVQQQVAQAMEHAYYLGLKNSEALLWVHEATKEHPQIMEVPEAFDAAMARERQADPWGDPQQWVSNATKAYLRTYKVYQNVKATKEGGRRVDVRGEQKPPASGQGQKTLPREGDKQPQGDDRGSLSPLFGLWGEPR